MFLFSVRNYIINSLWDPRALLDCWLLHLENMCEWCPLWVSSLWTSFHTGNLVFFPFVHLGIWNLVPRILPDHRILTFLHVKTIAIFVKCKWKKRNGFIHSGWLVGVSRGPKSNKKRYYFQKKIQRGSEWSNSSRKRKTLIFH